MLPPAASPSLRALVAKRFLGRDSTEEYVNWALCELLSGRDETSLCILAGLGRPLDRREVEYYFERSLQELGIILPDWETVLRHYAREIAGHILAGSMPPLRGCGELYEIWQALEYPAVLEACVMLAEGFDPDTYRELEGAELDAAIRREARVLLKSE